MRVCPSCGQPDDSGDAYCATPGCGARLPGEERPAQAEPTEAVPAPVQTPRARPAYRPWMSLAGMGVVVLAALVLLIPRWLPGTATPPSKPDAQPFEPPLWTVPPEAPVTSPPPPAQASPVPPPPVTTPPNPPRTTAAPTRPRTTAPPPPSPPPPQTQPCSALDGGSSTSNVDIPDTGTAVYSSFTISGYTGNAPATTHVHVDIKHTFRGDLEVDLVGPSGTSYRLKNANLGDSEDNLNVTYTVNASAQPCSGQWRLKVRDIDAEGAFTGYIDAWSIAFN